MLYIIAQNFQEIFVEWISYPPGSMFLIMGLSIFSALLSTILTKLFVDPKRLTEKQEKIKEHKKRRKEIEKMKDVNPKKYNKEVTKWERQDKSIQAMSNKMSLERMKPSCISMIPMLLIFQLVREFFGTAPVAIPAMNAWDVYWLGQQMWGFTSTIPNSAGMINYTAWYFLCSFTFSTIIQRLSGTYTGGSMGGLGDMFDQSQYDQYKT
ncbi:MAG: DUF106 domain-containing protein [archaeon]|nr:DUF106 domain-containing protein [archaeon]